MTRATLYGPGVGTDAADVHDPVTPEPMRDAFEDELTQAKVDWQAMMPGGAVRATPIEDGKLQESAFALRLGDS